MIVRRASDRGQTALDWLDARHTFSFGGYRDPRWIRFRGLRVLNDDRVAPGGGFGMHPHEEMEILSWVIEGRIEHRDSIGNGGVLGPGEIQTISAGRGISHSERNPSSTGPLRLLQIWIFPDHRGAAPRYETRRIHDARIRGRFGLVASPDGADDSVRIGADVRVYAARLEAGEEITHRLEDGRGAWLQVMRGMLLVDPGSDPVRLGDGDGAAVENADGIRVRAEEESEILLLDLA